MRFLILLFSLILLGCQLLEIDKEITFDGIQEGTTGEVTCNSGYDDVSKNLKPIVSMHVLEGSACEVVYMSTLDDYEYTQKFDINSHKRQTVLLDYVSRRGWDDVKIKVNEEQ